MKKYLTIAAVLTLFSAGSYAEGTAVSDQAVLTELQKIEQKLDSKQAQANPLNCTDGERSYSPGFKLNAGNQRYRCVVKDGHGEWEELMNFQ